MNLLKDNRNELLNRREIKTILEFKKNPGYEQAKKVLAEQLNVDENLIAIRELKSKFGRNTFLIDSFIYDSLEHKERFEPKKKKKKVEGGAN